MYESDIVCGNKNLFYLVSKFYKSTYAYSNKSTVEFSPCIYIMQLVLERCILFRSAYTTEASLITPERFNSARSNKQRTKNFASPSARERFMPMSGVVICRLPLVTQSHLYVALVSHFPTGARPARVCKCKSLFHCCNRGTVFLASLKQRRTRSAARRSNSSAPIVVRWAHTCASPATMSRRRLANASRSTSTVSFSRKPPSPRSFCPFA